MFLRLPSYKYSIITSFPAHSAPPFPNKDSMKRYPIFLAARRTRIAARRTRLMRIHCNQLVELRTPRACATLGDVGQRETRDRVTWLPKPFWVIATEEMTGRIKINNNIFIIWKLNAHISYCLDLYSKTWLVYWYNLLVWICIAKHDLYTDTINLFGFV